MQEHFILADPTKRQFVKKLNQRQDKYTLAETKTKVVFLRQDHHGFNTLLPFCLSYVKDFYVALHML